jgi:hypothetical protein
MEKIIEKNLLLDQIVQNPRGKEKVLLAQNLFLPLETHKKRITRRKRVRLIRFLIPHQGIKIQR